MHDGYVHAACFTLLCTSGEPEPSPPPPLLPQGQPLAPLAYGQGLPGLAPLGPLPSHRSAADAVRCGPAAAGIGSAAGGGGRGGPGPPPLKTCLKKSPKFA